MSDRTRPVAPGRPIPPLLLLGFVTAIAAVFTIAAFASRAVQRQSATAALVTHTLQVKQQIASVLLAVEDAETGQRGYLLTGEAEYLEPFENAETLPAKLEKLSELTADNPTQQGRISELGPLVREKLAELRHTIDLRRGGDSAAALVIVHAGSGKRLMDRIRLYLQGMNEDEDRLFGVRSAEWVAGVARATAVTLGGAFLILVLILTAGVGTIRELLARERQAWLRTGQAEVARAALVGEQPVEVLAQKVLEQSVRYTGAVVGTFHIVQEDGSMRRVASHALSTPTPTSSGEVIARGEGVAG